MENTILNKKDFFERMKDTSYKINESEELCEKYSADILDTNSLE